MDRASAPFRQIAESLREQIRLGVLGPGDRVPSTRDLARQWGVARGTVDRALSQLRDEGLVQITAGRSGTIVSKSGKLVELALTLDEIRVLDVQTVEVVSLEPDQATAIGVAPGTSLLKIKMRTA